MKRINLDQMKNMSIDNLIESYRNGYRLEEYTPITSLSNLPNFSNNFSNIHTLQGPLLDPVVNFGKVTVSTGYDAVATSIILNINEGSKLPDSSSVFNLVWWNSTDYPDPSDDPNKEIVRCTARTTDTLTVTRAQEGTSATTKNTVGKIYKMILSPTAKMMSDISSAITARVVKSGDTMTGPLNLPSNGLIVGTNQLIVSGGNVGIGTTSPSEKLTVDGKIMTGAQAVLYGMVPDGQFTASGANSPGTLALINTNTSNWTTVGEIRFGMNVVWSDPGTATISSQKIGGGSYGHAKGNLRFKIHDEVTGEGGLWRDAMTIISSGNVGIGTTNPQTKLQVLGTPDASLGHPQLSISGRSNNQYTTIGFGYDNGIDSTKPPAEIGYFETTNAGSTKGALIFATRDVITDTAAIEQMRIDTAGNVGIGTTTPTSLLDVNGTVQLRGIIGGTGLTVDAGGKVGIGTVSPSMQLEVAKSADYTIAGLSTWSATTYYHAPNLLLQRSKSSIIGTHTAVVANDYLGNIAFQGSDGAGFITAAGIRADAEGIITNNIVPGRLVFRTMNSAGIFTEAMHIDSSGNVGIGTSTPEALGIELVVDGGMELDNVTNWGNYNTPTIKEKNTVSPINGVRDLHIVGDAANDGTYQSYIPIIGKYYKIVFSYKVVSGILAVINGAKSLGTFTGTGTVTKYDISDGNPNIIFITSIGAGEFYVDDVSIKEVIVGSLAINGVLRVAGTGNSYISGNVGIGTTNPTAKLEVSGGDISIDSGRQIQMSSPGDTNWGIKITPNAIGSSPSMDFRAGVGNGYFRFIDTPGIPNVRMIIEGATGNVGIGTTTPTSLLDVNGTVQLRGIVGGTGLTVDAGGNVGIGTTIPSEMLTIRGNLRLGIQGSGGPRDPYIDMVDSTWGNSPGGRITFNGYNNRFEFSYLTGDTNPQTESAIKMVVTSDGKVGINTDTPVGILDVNGNTYLDNVYIPSGATFYHREDGSGGSGKDVYGAGGYTAQFYPYGNGNDPWVWYYEDMSTPLMMLHPTYPANQGVDGRLYVNGNVGIGTTDPDAKLQVIGKIRSGDTGTAGHITLARSSEGSDIGELTVEDSSGFRIRTQGGGSYIAFQTGSVTNAVRIIDNGNVGIGITTPTSKLQTSGSFSAQVITISGSVTLDETYYTVLCNAGTAFTVTLPDASTCPGRIYNIKKKDSSTNTVTIATTGGQTIDGATSRSINIQYETVSTQSDGIQWWIV